MNRSVKTKLAALIFLLLLLLFGPLLTYTISQLQRISLQNGELQAAQSVKNASESLQSSVNRLEASLQSLGTVFADASRSGTFSREDGIRLLGSELEKQPELLALYTLWEPQAFDGQDDQNRSKYSYDDPSGRYIPYVLRDGGQILTEPLQNYETPGTGDYYLVPKSTKLPYWSEPYLYPVNGQDVLISSLVVPILDGKGDFVGIVGADFSLAHFQSVTDTIQIYGGYGTIISQDGMYVSNSGNPEEINTPFTKRPELQTMWDGVQQGEWMHHSVEPDGERVIRIFAPIQPAGSSDRMFLQVVAYEDEVLADYRETMRSTILFALTIVVVLCLLLYLLVHISVREIGKINRLALKLSEGDFTDRLEVRSKDEFGDLNARLNHMMDTLRHALQTVSSHALSIGATSQQLTASAEHTGQAATLITDSIQRVAAGSESQRTDSQEVARSMEELAAGISRIADSASVLSEASIQIDAQTQQGNEQIQSAVSQMALVSDTVGQTKQVIEGLQLKSDTISTFVATITGLSGQTNILALNAAIEASRAGEHGRGFAVVAEEVRKLAEQSRQAAEQIAGLADEIRSQAQAAASAMALGVAETGRGAEAVQHSGRIFASIMQEMTEVNSQLGELSASAEQMAASVEEVNASSTQMYHVADQSAADAHHVAAASRQQLVSMQEVTAAADALSHMVEELVELMNKFKT